MMCRGCPFNYGDIATENAYNLGCLPSIVEVYEHVGEGAWPCHSNPKKICGGFLADNPSKKDAKLVPMEGVHYT